MCCLLPPQNVSPLDLVLLPMRAHLPPLPPNERPAGNHGSLATVPGFLLFVQQAGYSLAGAPKELKNKAFEAYVKVMKGPPTQVRRPALIYYRYMPHVERRTDMCVSV
jgi:hypothetical protein